MNPVPAGRRLPAMLARAALLATTAVLTAAAASPAAPASGPAPVRASAPADLVAGLVADTGGVFSHTVTFTMTATNNGPATTDGATIAMSIFQQQMWPTVVPGCRYQVFDYRCTVAPLAPGASTQFTFPATIRDADTGVTVFEAAAHQIGDPNLDNNRAAVTCMGLTIVVRC